MKILVGTPAYDDQVTTDYMMSVMKLFAYQRARRPELRLQHFFINATLIARARNAFASLVLEDPSFTHLLFIDSDIGFRPEAVVRMVDFDKEIAACVYPYRKFRHERLHAASRRIEDPLLARNVGMEYVASDRVLQQDLGDGRRGFVLDRGFLPTLRVGMGLTLIKRTVFETMAEREPDLMADVDAAYRGLGVKHRVLQCFESMKASNGVYLGEDLSFCRRWIDICGGEIWACVDETLTHVGRVQFEGRFVDQLRNPET